jgi:hypothetical protein
MNYILVLEAGDEKAADLNAVKIWFSVLARKLLKANNFTRTSGKPLSCSTLCFVSNLTCST